MKIKCIQLFAISLAVILLVSCQKDETSQAPVIPPYETMATDFGSFSTYNKSVTTGTLSNVSWLYSASSVVFWNSLIKTTFAVPVAAFKAALSENPTKIDDTTWEWNYTYNGTTGQYAARLVGKVQATQIKWEMYISKTGANSFSDFLWFEGTSNLDGDSGQWTLYQSPDYPDKAVIIDWEKTDSTVDKITYTYVRETDDQGNPLDPNGSYLIYGTQEGTFDSYITNHHYYHAAEAFVDVNIEWSSSDYSGRVKAEQFFGDTDWHCWDSEGNDTDCN